MILDETRRIIRSDGVDALSTRKVAGGIGYTVGTIYQHFDNMDSLVEAANRETLAALFEACLSVDIGKAPRDNLIALARAFVGFVHENPNDWAAVVSYRYAPDHEWTQAYDRKVEALLGLMAQATRSLYREDQQEQHLLDMRILWASMYGIFSLDAVQRLGKYVTLEGMILSLVDMYLASK